MVILPHELRVDFVVVILPHGVRVVFEVVMG